MPWKLVGEIAANVHGIPVAELAWLGDYATRREHGDLLGQNLLFDPDRPIVVLDWERAIIGDPAYDLAIVTRGIRRPFQAPEGLTKLLDAYTEHSDVELRESEVRFHEIALHLRWYAETFSDEEHGEPAPSIRARLRNLLRAVWVSGA